MLNIKSFFTFTLLYEMLWNAVKAKLNDQNTFNTKYDSWTEMCSLLDINHGLMNHAKDTNSYDRGMRGMDWLHLSKLRKVDEYYQTVRGFEFNVKTIYNILR